MKYHSLALFTIRSQLHGKSTSAVRFIEQKYEMMTLLVKMIFTEWILLYLCPSGSLGSYCWRMFTEYRNFDKQSETSQETVVMEHH